MNFYFYIKPSVFGSITIEILFHHFRLTVNLRDTQYLNNWNPSILSDEFIMDQRHYKGADDERVFFQGSLRVYSCKTYFLFEL